MEIKAANVYYEGISYIIEYTLGWDAHDIADVIWQFVDYHAINWCTSDIQRKWYRDITNELMVMRIFKGV